MVWPAVRRQVDPLQNAFFGLELGRALVALQESDDANHRFAPVLRTVCRFSHGLTLKRRPGSEVADADLRPS